MNETQHRAAVDQLIEDRQALLSQIEVLRRIAADGAQGVALGIVEVAEVCGPACPALQLLDLTRRVFLQMDLNADWVDHLHDAVGGVE